MISHVGPRAALALVLLGSVAPLRAQERVEAALPADTLAWLSVDVGRAVRDYGGLDVVRLFRDEEVQEFLAPALEALNQTPEWNQIQAALFMADAYGFPQVIAGRISLAVTGVGVRADGSEMRWYSPTNPPARADLEGQRMVQVVPDVVVTVETSGRAAFEASLQRLLELDPEMSTRAVERDGHSYSESTIPVPNGEEHLYHAFAGDLFVATLREERLHEVLGALGAAPNQDGLGSDPAFRRWRAVSARGGELLEAYVGLGHLALAALPLMDADEREHIRTHGLDELRGIGFTLGMEAGRLRDTLALIVPEQRRGALALLDAFRPGADVAADVPARSTAALAWRVDLATLYDRVESLLEAMSTRDHQEFQRDMEQARQALGFPVRDLLASLDAGVSVSAALPRSGFIPETLGILRLKDPGAFARFLTRIKELVKQEAGTEVELMQQEMAGVQDLFYARIQEAPVTPAFALKGDRLLIGQSLNIVKSHLSRGQDGASMTENADFAQCVATTVGAQFADVAGMFYVDLAAASQWGLGFAEMFLPAITRELPVELDPALFPMPETVAGYLSGILLTLRVGKDYAAIDSSSPFGGLILPILGGAAANVAHQQARREAVFAEFEAQAAAQAAVANADAPFLGINHDPAQPAADGVLIQSLVSGAPAEKAGLQANDVIVAFGDTAIAGPADFSAAIRGKRAGDQVVITVRREQELFTFPVVLGRRGDHVK